MLGTMPTSSGVRVSQDTALTYSAVFACTRVISETMASLPLALLEQVDDRTTRKAVEKPLYGVLHDMPNPEMDIATFLDMQVAVQLNWGNAYCEKQYDSAGNVVGLWPIHPSRIPLSNLYRNTTDPHFFRQIVVGQPGELIYDVNNDDGTVTPIPASDMFHVPGVLSRNGITGLSIPMTGSEAIGIAMATDKHAGAYFRNGAVSNMAIKSPKIVKKETAEYLREQWQKTFGGVQNHYKTLLLEDGMEPVSFSIAPEASQLIESRQLGAREIARLYRVPPHMIADLSRATWANIESEEIAFVIHTMLPWITRWEKAIYRQLLSPAERLKYRAKFNVMGLLRGDSASRGQFYQVLFNLGALSPNDVRDFEDMNPIDGGDQYFVPANNLVPLDKIAEKAQAEIDKLKAPPPAPQQNAIPDEQTASMLVEIRDQQREFMDKVLLRDSTAAAREAARIEFDRQERAKDIEQYGAALEEILLRHREQAELARDTAEIERLAAEKARFDDEKAEFEAKSASERAALQKLLVTALKREIDKLTEWESKWLQKAIDKPLEWVDARSEFYGRFRKYFEANLGEYAPDALACGIVLDVKWGADRYSGDSIRDLKSLDAAAADNYHDRLKETVNIFRNSQWKDRTAALAGEMVERGVRLFNEQEQNDASDD